ncbi:MAG: ACP S-malonyltransferase [Deltaproteobacteria bacterium]|nr:ACP S-malonyltransferase [Deltaproteobacteria bacterium]
MSNLALLFPGQGSQQVGMGKDFFENFRESQLVFEEAADTIKVNLKHLCFEGPMDALTLTENLQPALFTVEMAILAALEAHAGILTEAGKGADPVLACAGHSLGEYSALCAAGALSIVDGARLTRLRGSAMQRAVPAGLGSMAAILGLSAEAVEALCAAAHKESGETVEPANFNAPGQVVISGSKDGVDKACALLKNEPAFKGGKSIPLQVSAPFHCALMKPAQDEMAPMIRATVFVLPSCAVIPNCTAEPSRDVNHLPEFLIRQIVEPVRWDQSMGKLRALGVEKVLEIGPGKVLAGLMKRIERDLPVANIASVQAMRQEF